MARRLVLWYDGHLRKAPLRTKAISSFTILTGADLFRQRFLEEPASPRTSSSCATHRSGSTLDSTGRAPRYEDSVSVAAVPVTDWWDQERTARMALFSCSLHPVWVHQ